MATVLAHPAFVALPLCDLRQVSSSSHGVGAAVTVGGIDGETVRVGRGLGAGVGQLPHASLHASIADAPAPSTMCSLQSLWGLAATHAHDALGDVFPLYLRRQCSSSAQGVGASVIVGAAVGKRVSGVEKAVASYPANFAPAATRTDDAPHSRSTP